MGRALSETSAGDGMTPIQRTRTRPRPEREIQRVILDWLKLQGIFAWRQNTGAVTEGKRFIRFSIPGCADILGVLPGGRFLALEVKRPGHPPTPEQYAFLRSIERAGGLAAVVTSLEDAMAVLR